MLSFLKKKKGEEHLKESIHIFVILFIAIVICAILTYIVPAGIYDRYEDPETGKMLIDAGTFHYVDSNPAEYLIYSHQW